MRIALTRKAAVNRFEFRSGERRYFSVAASLVSGQSG